MATLVLHAALAASLLGSFASRGSDVRAHESCAAATADISSWPIVRSPRVPGLTLRLPRTFERAAAGSAPSFPATPVASERWSHAAQGQLVITRGGAAPDLVPARAAAGPAYSRCEERVGSAVAVIESYDRGASGAAAAGERVFHVRARFRWPDGEELVVLGDAADRERFAELLAAVRTIRRTSA